MTTRSTRAHVREAIQLQRAVKDGAGKKEQADQYRRHNLIVDFRGFAPDELYIEFLDKVLCFNKPSEITEKHISLCLNIFNNRVIMPLPIPSAFGR